MRSILIFVALFASAYGFAEKRTADTSKPYQLLDTVTITSLGNQPLKNIPYSLQRVALGAGRNVPHTHLMQVLNNNPSVNSISVGSGINKPVLRGLSFNHFQIFANGARIDNQTWDDRHDIGIAENGYDKVEIINGPAALLYGPNAMAGAFVFSETAPSKNEKTNGYAQLGFFGNSMGGNLSAGVRQDKEKFYYTLHASYQMHANYVQGEGEEKVVIPGEDKPLAANSKFTTYAFKGMVGFRNEKSQHQFTYNFYKQQLGVIEDESTGGTQPVTEERDYEMEAPYQDVTTHVISSENKFKTSASELEANIAYQMNDRKEYEPGLLPKSKFLGVGLQLHTFTADVKWNSNKKKLFGISTGIQYFNQQNKNNGNWVLVPDANINTVGGYAVLHYNIDHWNFMGGLRIDAHELSMRKTTSSVPDTITTPFGRPSQDIKRTYSPFSFSAGLVYHVNGEISLKLNAANGYTAPNYAQLAAYGIHEGTYRFEVGNNNLQEERNTQVDLSLLWERPDFSLHLGGYINSIRNYIFIAPTGDSASGYKIYRWKQDDASIRGIEMNLQFHPVSTKWFEAFVNIAIIKGDLSNGNNLPYIPAQKIITGFNFKKDSWKKWRDLFASVQLQAYGKQDRVAEFEEPTDGYLLADLYLGSQLPLGKQNRWGLNLFCKNLFNKGYYNHLSLIKAIGVREPGRNIGFQLNYRF
jgi:iron complex outermembrane receptor protein